MQHNINELMLTASFMGDGFNQRKDSNAILAQWDNGHLELIGHLTSTYVPYVTALYHAASAAGFETPGVFDYETSESFGHWFGEAMLAIEEPCTVPPPAEGYAKARELVFEFFSRAWAIEDGHRQATELKAVLDAVPAPAEKPYV